MRASRVLLRELSVSSEFVKTRDGLHTLHLKRVSVQQVSISANNFYYV
jgi:hypothetical protein